MTPDPRTLYTARLAERRAEIAHQEQRHRGLGHGKLVMAAFGVGLVWLALAQEAFSILWVLIPIAGFVLADRHSRAPAKELERRRRAARFFEKALARLDGNWAGTGEPGERYNDAAHPYALDLDLFGKGSVFELLCTARTRIGEDRLAQWLKSPPNRPRCASASGRWTNCATAWTCAKNSPSWRRKRARAWTRYNWRNGAKLPACFGSAASDSGSGCLRRSGSPALPRSGFTCAAPPT